jgi:signal transduction histidine kinase
MSRTTLPIITDFSQNNAQAQRRSRRRLAPVTRSDMTAMEQVDPTVPHDLPLAISANQELERLKHDFVARISHELRTPLTTVIAGSHILAKGDLTEEKMQHLAAKVEEQAKNLGVLIDDMLEIAKADIDCSVPRPNLVALGPIVREITGSLQLRPESYRIEAQIPEDLPLVRGDRSQLSRAIRVLVENAVRYSPMGGMIAIEASAGDTFICVAVSDQGVGISRDRLDLIFQPFYRVQGSLNQRVKGAGLGLAICRHIVESHGGEIWVESQVGKGSTFFFALPSVVVKGSHGLVC